MPKFLTNLDLSKNELQNVILHPLATAPGSPTQGQMYYNTADKKAYLFNGSTWVLLTPVEVQNIGSLNDIADISITLATTGDILRWNGTTWVNSSLAAAGIASTSDLHPAVTVTDSTSIDFTLTGQNITASAIFGTTAGTVAEGNHTHAAYVNQNAFSNVAVSGQTTVAADTTTDTLTLVAGPNVAITTNATTDTITISSTDTVYTHPTYTARSVDTDLVEVLDTLTSDTTGHITGVTKRSLPNATTSTAGVMSSADKTKLDGIETGAQVNTVTSVAGKTGAVTLTSSNVGLGNVTNDAQVKKLASSTNGNVPIWNGTTGDALSNGYSITTNISTSATSSQLARADAIKAYVDGILATNDAMVFKGTLGTGGTVTALPTTHNVGWTYKVITAGTYAGKVAEIGDMFISIVSRTGTGNTNNDWSLIQTNIDGAVIGPATVTNGNIAVFDGTSGKIIRDGGAIPIVNNGTLTMATSGIATGSATFTANQSTGSTFTVAVPGTNIAEGTRTSTTVPITSSTGTGATLSAATTSLAGVMTSADKTKLDGIAAGAQVNVATNLGYTAAATTGTVTSSTGTSATIPAATQSLAGLLTGADKTKLDGIASNANNYVLPVATSTVLGGIELFSDTQQTVAANAVTATASRTYGIQLNSNGQAVVNVPWSDTNTTYSAGNGIGLASTTFSVAAGTGLVQETSGLAHADTSTLTGVQGGSGIASVTVDGMGHVTAVTTAVYMRKYAETLSTSATSYTVTHGLNTQDAVVTIREVGTPYAEVYCDVEFTTVNTITIRFATAPTANQYRVVVIG